MRIALIDGDLIVYGQAFAAQSRKALGNKVTVTRSNKKIDMAIEELVDGIKEGTGADEVRMYLTHRDNELSTNFRKSIATTLPYKGNRTTDKPLKYQYIRDYLTKRYSAIKRPNMEADDAIGMDHTSWLQAGDTPIICSFDKDMQTIAGLHYDWRNNTLKEVSEEEATRNWGMQLIKGDRVDNIPGLHHFVKELHGTEAASALAKKRYLKDAEQRMEGCKTLEEVVEVVRDIYLDAQVDFYRLVEVMKLVTIVTDPTFDPLTYWGDNEKDN